MTLFVATRTLDVQLESWLDYAARVFMWNYFVLSWIVVTDCSQVDQIRPHH